MDTTRKSELKRVQEILLKNLEELTEKHNENTIDKKDLEYSRVLLSNTNKLVNTAKLEIEYVKVKKELHARIDFFE